MANFVELKCPQCGYTWQIDYERLQQDYRPFYKSLDAPVGRRKEYIIRCPNHGEEVVITLQEEE